MKRESESELVGWKEISEFLGQPFAVVRRWSKEGLPVRREGRYTVASRAELRSWLGRAVGVKSLAYINDLAGSELSTELRRSVQAAKSHRRK